MSHNQYLAEEKGIKSAFSPVDLNAAAVTGNRVKLDKAGRCAVVIAMGSSTAATVQITLRQHNAASAGTSKDVVVANSYFHKAGAATSFTRVEPTVAAALVDVSAVFAADGGVLVVEVVADQLDANGGFAWFSVDVADATAAKIGSGNYVLGVVCQKSAHNIAF